MCVEIAEKFFPEIFVLWSAKSTDCSLTFPEKPAITSVHPLPPADFQHLKKKIRFFVIPSYLPVASRGRRKLFSLYSKKNLFHEKLRMLHSSEAFILRLFLWGCKNRPPHHEKKNYPSSSPKSAREEIPLFSPSAWGREPKKMGGRRRRDA